MNELGISVAKILRENPTLTTKEALRKASLHLKEGRMDAALAWTQAAEQLAKGPDDT